MCENLKMSAPLLSRFDIVFILLDTPAQDQDEFLSEHILSLHAAGGGGSGAGGGGGAGGNGGADARRRMLMRKRKASAAAESSQQSQGSSSDPHQQQGGSRGQNGLKERLERAAAENRDPIPPPLLRKYIAYARKYATHMQRTHAHSARVHTQNARSRSPVFCNPARGLLDPRTQVQRVVFNENETLPVLSS